MQNKNIKKFSDFVHRGIMVGDIVKHKPSGLHYKCENKQQERWMNMSEEYEKEFDPEILAKYDAQNKKNF